MPSNITIINTTNADLVDISSEKSRANGVLLAESDPVEVARIRADIDPEFHNIIKVVKSYEELLERIAEQRPELVLLGRIDKFNYFDTCKECQLIHQDLPIVLLSRQEVINSSFLKLAVSRGLTDIINPDPIKLTQLFQSLKNDSLPPSLDLSIDRIEDLSIDTTEARSSITGKMMLAALGEIVTITNNYFGPLAQGNYWRKSHTSIVNDLPSLQNWSADHFSKINCNDLTLERELTNEDIQNLRIWVRIFIGECERIIVDFGVILNNSDLSSIAKDLLSES
jgi:AmiR/NasT family two-component response regulator